MNCIKVWILADSVNDYIIDFKVYIGKEGDTVEKNLGMKVVSELTSKLPSGHHVCFDNYFTSLYSHNVHFVHTRVSLCNLYSHNVHFVHTRVDLCNLYSHTVHFAHKSQLV